MIGFRHLTKSPHNIKINRLGFTEVCGDKTEIPTLPKTDI